MDNDSGQTEERSESRQERENELRSIREIIERMAEAMKALEEKHAEGLSTLADLLTDLNATGERLIELGIEIRDRLQPPAK